MPPASFDALLDEFRRSMEDCRRLYVDSARQVAAQHPDAVEGRPDAFIRMMDDLHRGLLIKLYITVAEADRKWTRGEQRLAEALMQHLWDRRVSGRELTIAMDHLADHAVNLRWYSLVRPFDRVTPLRERIAELEIVIARFANLVAKADGQTTPEELAQLETIRKEMEVHLRPLRLDGVSHENVSAGREAVQAVRAEAASVHRSCTLDDSQAPDPKIETSPQSLEEALGELDALIGLASIKQEVRTLINFLRLQEQRRKMDLPDTELSLHMVFRGNPGTGKTTVARIVGQIFGAMGILQKGHVVETDRSGLVAEFAGQTAPKVNKLVDQALDGILFIDEAYALVDEKGDDALGREAVQTLLKRMEDDRKRLVVILAGYPLPMDRLLAANPGLSSRFNYHLTFEDYTAGELGWIFGKMCEKNHFDTPADPQARLLLGFQCLVAGRDEHFGNGRVARNIFERAVRRLANRIAEQTELTRELLTRFETDDVDMPDVPPEFWQGVDWESQQFRIACPDCGLGCSIRTTKLARRVICPQCKSKFIAAWGEPLGTN